MDGGPKSPSTHGAKSHCRHESKRNNEPIEGHSHAPLNYDEADGDRQESKHQASEQHDAIPKITDLIKFNSIRFDFNNDAFNPYLIDRHFVAKSPMNTAIPTA